VAEVILNGKADAVCAASIFHYKIVQGMIQKVESKNFEEGNIEFLKGALPLSSIQRRHITPTAIPDLKKHLDSRSIACRPFNEERGSVLLESMKREAVA